MGWTPNLRHLVLTDQLCDTFGFAMNFVISRPQYFNGINMKHNYEYAVLRAVVAQA